MKYLFIPYELSLLSKEKGFNEPCLAKYTGCNIHGLPPKSIWMKQSCNKDLIDDTFGCISAPIYQQIIDWFETKHGLSLTP